MFMGIGYNVIVWVLVSMVTYVIVC